jgi:hypothetical protein
MMRPGGRKLRLLHTRSRGGEARLAVEGWIVEADYTGKPPALPEDSKSLTVPGLWTPTYTDITLTNGCDRARSCRQAGATPVLEGLASHQVANPWRKRGNSRLYA